MSLHDLAPTTPGPSNDTTPDKRSDTAPEWSTFAAELTCPLCEYNLRGLTEPRCPECGFVFRWAELLDARRDRHRYLFEHGRGHERRSLMTTYLLTSAPRRFWRDVTPVHTVHVRRLLLYWLIASVPILGIVATRYTTSFYEIARRNQNVRANYLRYLRLSPPGAGGRTGVSPAQLDKQIDQMFPPVWSARFFEQVLNQRTRSSAAFVEAAAIVASWPWLTLATLMIFQASMRRAKVRRRHALRVVIYGCDFALLLLVCSVFFSTQLSGSLYLSARRRSWPMNTDVGQMLLLTALVCAFVGGYRMAIAYRQYLRFHLPAATIWASQIICLLVVLVIIVQIAPHF